MNTTAYLYAPTLGVLTAGLIAVIILYIVKTRRASADAIAFPGAALVLLFKKRAGDTDWADNNYILTVDGEPAHMFAYRLGIQACHVPSGCHTITVKSSWGRVSGGKVAVQSTQPCDIRVQVRAEGHYSLEYHIPDGQYVFEEYEDERLLR